MKKILAILMTMVLASSAYAQKTVQVVWPFSIVSSQANMVRSIIDNANTQQNKYQFILIHKPGAGGTIGANIVAESKELTILSTTSSFYIRPMLFKESHNIDDFHVISLVCSAQPLAIFSKKISRIEGHGRDVSIGINPGSITTLVTNAIKRENPDIKIIEVPYKGTPEATSDMLGGHIDGSVDFIGTSVTSRFGNDIKVLGITGTKSYLGYQTFQSLKVKGLEQVANDYYFLVNKSVDVSTRQELNKILNDAVGEKAKFFCEDDFGQVSKTPWAQTEAVHKSSKARWEKLTAGFVKE